MPSTKTSAPHGPSTPNEQVGEESAQADAGRFNRRELIVAGAGAVGVALIAGAGCAPSAPSASGAGSPSVSAAGEPQRTATQAARMPVAFLPHGGGPWPWVDVGFDAAGNAELAAYLRSVASLPKVKPKALLVISAHWEERVPTVMTSARPPMLYDYYGFPPESYEITWPAPGDPKLAARVQELLALAGIPSQANAERGFDHGAFVPLKLTYPDADIPVVQLSLEANLDPARHLALGRALAPLRDEGVFIIGSGMTFHNLRAFRDPRARPVAEQFDAWLRAAATAEPAERDRQLTAWASAPSARLAHPREEHLLPLMVIAGAAGADRGTVAYNGAFGGLRLSAVHFA
jgi:aromatic ring-opening dioxygenase catalytic subunit (LigB family)